MRPSLQPSLARVPRVPRLYGAAHMVRHNRTSDFNDATSRKSRELPPASLVAAKPLVLPHQRLVDSLTKSALIIASGIAGLKKFLHTNRRDYLNLSQYIYEKASSMTDQERDGIDRESTLYIKDCQKQIEAFQARGADLQSVANANEQLHFAGIAAVLFARLDEVTSIYTKLRTLRFQQNLLLARTLAPPPRKSAPKGQPQAFKKLEDKRKAGEYIENLALSQEEQKQFAMEMDVIKRNLDGEDSQVKAVEAQMTEIAQLQDLFTNKLVEQGETIGNIHEAVMAAVSHVESGNKQLRDASSASDFRLFIALFFFTAGLALLFVHWYE